MNIQEIWLPLPGYESYYRVSNLGRVSSFPRVDCRGQRVGGRILSPAKAKGHRGYFTVGISVNGAVTHIAVHRLVALTFVSGRSPDRNVINHINAVKTDNRAANLEWVTHQGNFDHAAALGLCNRGEKNQGAKLSESDVLEIRRMCAEGFTNKQVCDLFNISAANTSRIANNKSWKYLLTSQ